MKLVDVAVLVLAILSIVFGLIGFTGAMGGNPSVMSLVAGGGLGAALIGFLAFTKTNPRVGRIGSAVVTLVLVGWSTSNFFSKGLWFPHGIIMIVSIITLALLVGGHFSAMKARKAQI
jgi:hypothetical protein